MSKTDLSKRTRPCVTAKAHKNKAQSTGFGWVSSNWSGYAISGKKGAFRQISGDWIVPFIKATSKTAYSSAWIGIDGFKNSNLIQTGTGHESINGVVHYYAWWEILPAAETVIPLPVSPGDHMRASITKESSGKWLITLRNLSKQWTFRTFQRYTGPQSSAEWIMEAPQVGGKIGALSKMTATRFFRCSVNGKSPRLTPADSGIMVQNKITVAVPSSPSANGDAFNVKRVYRKGKPLVHSRSPIFVRS
ncbi:G1 family glutamic endopeptidase [Paenibacillus sp. BAC0078]